MPSRNEHPSDNNKHNSDNNRRRQDHGETKRKDQLKRKNKDQKRGGTEQAHEGDHLEPPPGDPPEHEPAAASLKTKPVHEHDDWPLRCESLPVEKALGRLWQRLNKLQNEVFEVDEAVFELQSELGRNSSPPSVPPSGGSGCKTIPEDDPDSKTIARLRSVKYVADGPSKGIWEAEFLYDDDVYKAKLTDKPMELLLNLVDWFATDRKLPEIQTRTELAEAVTNGKWSNLTTLIQRLRDALKEAKLPRSLLEMTPRDGAVDVRYQIRVIGGLPVLDDATADTSEMRSWLSRLNRRKGLAS